LTFASGEEFKSNEPTHDINSHKDFIEVPTRLFRSVREETVLDLDKWSDGFKPVEPFYRKGSNIPGLKSSSNDEPVISPFLNIAIRSPHLDYYPNDAVNRMQESVHRKLDFDTDSFTTSFDVVSLDFIGNPTLDSIKTFHPDTIKDALIHAASGWFTDEYISMILTNIITRLVKRTPPDCKITTFSGPLACTVYPKSLEYLRVVIDLPNRCYSAYCPDAMAYPGNLLLYVPEKMPPIHTPKLLNRRDALVDNRIYWVALGTNQPGINHLIAVCTSNSTDSRESMLQKEFGTDLKSMIRQRIVVGSNELDSTELERIIKTALPDCADSVNSDWNWQHKDHLPRILSISNTRFLTANDTIIKMHDYAGPDCDYSVVWNGTAPKLVKTTRKRQNHVKLEQWSILNIDQSTLGKEHTSMNSLSNLLREIAVFAQHRIYAHKEYIIDTNTKALARCIADYLIVYDYQHWKRQIHENPGTYLIHSFVKGDTHTISIITSRSTKHNLTSKGMKFPLFTYTKQILSDLLYYPVLRHYKTKALRGWGGKDSIFVDTYIPYDSGMSAGYGYISINSVQYECFTSQKTIKSCGHYMNHILSSWHNLAKEEILGWTDDEYKDLNYPDDGVGENEMRKSCAKAKIPFYLIKDKETLDAAVVYYETARPALWFVVTGTTQHYVLAIKRTAFMHNRPIPNLNTPGELMRLLGSQCPFDENESLLVVLTCHYGHYMADNYKKEQTTFYKTYPDLMTPEEVSRTLKQYDYRTQYDIPKFGYSWKPKNKQSDFLLEFHEASGIYTLTPQTDYARAKISKAKKLIPTVPTDPYAKEMEIIKDFGFSIQDVVRTPNLTSKEEEKQTINKFTKAHAAEEHKDTTKPVPKVTFNPNVTEITLNKATGVFKTRSDEVSEKSLATESSRKIDFDAEYSDDEPVKKTFVRKFKGDEESDIPTEFTVPDVLRILREFRPTHIMGPSGASALNKARSIWAILKDGLAKISIGTRSYSFNLTMSFHPNDDIIYVHPVTFIRREHHSIPTNSNDIDRMIDTFILPKMAAGTLNSKDIILCVEYVRIRCKVELDTRDYDDMVLRVTDRINICKQNYEFLVKYYNMEFLEVPSWCIFPSLYCSQTDKCFMPMRVFGIIPIYTRFDNFGKMTRTISTINNWATLGCTVGIMAYVAYKLYNYKKSIKAKLQAVVEIESAKRVKEERDKAVADAVSEYANKVGVFKRIKNYLFGAEKPETIGTVVKDSLKEFFLTKHITWHGRETLATSAARSVRETADALKGFGESPYISTPITPTRNSLGDFIWRTRNLSAHERDEEFHRRVTLWTNLKRFRDPSSFLNWRYGGAGIEYEASTPISRLFNFLYTPLLSTMSLIATDFPSEYHGRLASKYPLGHGSNDVPQLYDDNTMKLLNPIAYKKNPTTQEEYLESRRIARALKYQDNLSSEPVDRVVMTGVKTTTNDNFELLAEKPLEYYVRNAEENIEWQKKDNKYIQTKHATNDVYMNANAKIAEMNDYNFLHALINRQVGTLLSPDPGVMKDF